MSATPAAAATEAPAADPSAELLHIRERKPIWKSHGRRADLPLAGAGASGPVAAVAAAVAPSSGSDAAAAAAAAFSFVTPSATATGADAFVPLVHIDESQFDEDITALALRVPAKLCGSIIQQLKGLAPPQAPAEGAAAAIPSAVTTTESATAAPPSWLFTRPRISAVIDGPSKDVKFILLSETLRTVADLALLPPETRALLDQHSASITPCLYTFTLTYDYFPQDVALARLLPKDVQVPAGFETIGHIAHLNLAEQQLPWGGLIARVLLDKNPHLRTVVSKVGTISSEFRVFDMAVLGGARSCVTEVREAGCVFRFDFSRVYWNSRLSTEHARMIACFRPRQLVVDLMAGIGPFVVPGARELGAQKGFLGGKPALYANDLNPDSFASLTENLARNKVAGLVHASNMDGRAFLWEVVRPAQLAPGGAALGERAAHVLMNLPAIAIEFLDAFVGLYADEDDAAGTVEPVALAALRASPPLVHVYCFSKEVENPLSDLVPRVEQAMGAPMPPPVWVKDIGEQRDKKGKSKEKYAAAGKKEQAKAPSASAPASASSPVIDSVPVAATTGAAAAGSTPAPLFIPSTSLPSREQSFVRFVRNVAPNKDMYCISFHVPLAVLTATPSWRTKQRQQQQEDKQPAQGSEEEKEAGVAKRKREEEEAAQSVTTKKHKDAEVA